ncbi:MAG TPA: TetR/AcrR family transcriptional regulator [Thermoanaerobaculia bacterium]|nr:TetR/AcrR family transcriptional regulator [Thermoanaerobaculia bacterium]
MSVQESADNTQTSRTRLLNAGKMLFAKHGYEQTSTSAIAREAGSSESQLIRYFGGKAGLLEAIFNESWTGLNSIVEEYIADAKHGRDAILRLLTLMIRAFNRDHDIGFLFLFEGRRMRGNIPEVHLSKGFAQFMTVVNAQIERGREDGSIRKDIDARVLCSAMLGSAEGMVRDRIMSERSGETTHPFTDQNVLAAFEAVVNGLS